MPTLIHTFPSGTVSLFDEVTGGITSVSTGLQLTDIARFPNGDVYGTTFGSLYRINVSNGTSTPVGSHGLSLNALSTGPGGFLYGIPSGGGAVYRLDPNTAKATLIGNLNGFQSSGDLIYDDRSSQFFATATGSSTSDNLFAFQLTPSGQVSSSRQIGSVGFEDVWGLSIINGVLRGYTGDREISIDPGTGRGSFIRQISGLSASLGGASEQLGGSTPSNLSVYRIFDSVTGTHIYTASETERTSQFKGSRYREEGAVFKSAGPNSVERFINTKTGAFFYTINPSERDQLIRANGDFRLQANSGFQASSTPQAGYTPVYRFFNTGAGVHFYTANPREADQVLLSLPSFRYEGIGYYALPNQ